MSITDSVANQSALSGLFPLFPVLIVFALLERHGKISSLSFSRLKKGLAVCLGINGMPSTKGFIPWFSTFYPHAHNLYESGKKGQ
jgi:hypothetical protein